MMLTSDTSDLRLNASLSQLSNGSIGYSSSNGKQTPPGDLKRRSNAVDMMLPARAPQELMLKLQKDIPHSSSRLEFLYRVCDVIAYGCDKFWWAVCPEDRNRHGDG